MPHAHAVQTRWSVGRVCASAKMPEQNIGDRRLTLILKSCPADVWNFLSSTLCSLSTSRYLDVLCQTMIPCTINVVGYAALRESDCQDLDILMLAPLPAASLAAICTPLTRHTTRASVPQFR